MQVRLEPELHAIHRDLVQPEAMTSIYDMLRTLDPELHGAQVNLSNTFGDRFVKKATG